MMRYYPEDESDREELVRLNAEPWMVEQLKLNPSYCSWGPGEDYMPGRRDNTESWRSALFFDRWDEMFALDDLNEVVHFHFEVTRDSLECASCIRTGYNPETRKLEVDFYDFDCTGRRWCDQVTQDEVDALVHEGRLWDLTRDCTPGVGWVDKVPPHHPTADEVNAWQRTRGFGHDAINRSILVKTRAERLGVWGECEECGGHGYVYTEPAARLALVLWVLHPRKGASRGVEIREIRQDELPAVYAYLREAAARNAERFGRIPV